MPQASDAPKLQPEYQPDEQPAGQPDDQPDDQADKKAVVRRSADPLIGGNYSGGEVG